MARCSRGTTYSTNCHYYKTQRVVLLIALGARERQNK